MFISKSTTIFQKMLLSELRDAHSQYQAGAEVTHTYSAPKFVDGNVLAPISPEKQSTTDLMSKYRFAVPKEQELDTFNAEDFLYTMKKTMISLDQKVSYTTALQIIADYIEKAGSNFYGAVLRNGKNHLINPLHPLVAIASTEEVPSGEFKLILYFYEDRAKADLKYKTAEANEEYIKANINAQLRAYSTDAVTTALCTASERNDKDYSIDMEFRAKIKFTRYDAIRKASANKEYYLSAQQVLTRGIFIPYYGTSIIRKTPEGNGEGLSMTPFLAVNIGSPRYDELVKDDIATFTGICTGSQPKSTLKGIRVLTHANLSSPMNRHTILPTALAFADHCINTSISIYNKAGMLNKAPVIPTNYEEPDLLTGIDPEHLELYIEDSNTFTAELLSTTSMLTSEIVNIYNTLLNLDKQGKLDEYKDKKPNEEEDNADVNNDSEPDPR